MSEIPPESEWPSGFVPKAHMESKIKERTDQQALVIRELKGQLATAQQQATEYPTLKKQFDEYRANIELESHFRGAGLSLDGVADDKKPEIERRRTTLKLLHQADNAGKEEKDHVQFADWLKGPALEDPVAKMLLPPPAAGGSGSGTSGGASGAGGGSGGGQGGGTSGVRQNAQQVPPVRKLTEAELRKSHSEKLAEASRAPSPEKRRELLQDAQKMLDDFGKS